MPSESDEIEVWPEYLGKPNSQPILREKANIVSRLIEIAIDVGMIAKSLVEESGSASQHTPDLSLRAEAETAALLLLIIDEMASRSLLYRDKAYFMTQLGGFVGQLIEQRGLLEASVFAKLSEARRVEYANYEKWIAEEGQTAKGTVLWEYAKKVALALGIGRNALFNMTLSILLAKQIRRWNVVELLRG